MKPEILAQCRTLLQSAEFDQPPSDGALRLAARLGLSAAAVGTAAFSASATALQTVQTGSLAAQVGLDVAGALPASALPASALPASAISASGAISSIAPELGTALAPALGVALPAAGALTQAGAVATSAVATSAVATSAVATSAVATSAVATSGSVLGIAALAKVLGAGALISGVVLGGAHWANQASLRGNQGSTEPAAAPQLLSPSRGAPPQAGAARAGTLSLSEETEPVTVATQQAQFVPQPPLPRAQPELESAAPRERSRSVNFTASEVSSLILNKPAAVLKSTKELSPGAASSVNSEAVLAAGVATGSEAAVPRLQAGNIAQPGTPPPVEKASAGAPLDAELALLTRARSTLRSGRAHESLQWCESYLAQFPRGLLRTEAAVLHVEALYGLGRVEQARAEAKHLLQNGAASAYRKRFEAFGILSDAAPSGAARGAE